VPLDQVVREALPGAADVRSPLRAHALAALAALKAAGKIGFVGITGLPLAHLQRVLSAAPPGSVDVVLMVRMYHEIEQPYALLWRLHAALKPGGIIAIAERNRPTAYHGAPPDLLRCELAAVGFAETGFHDLGPETGYLALFAPKGPVPAPGAINACKG
jgi:SAM-dependent methyltransferase